MAKLTIKQYKDINAKCKNGFGLDYEWFCTWGEKQLRKDIVIDDFTVVSVIISFRKTCAGERWSQQIVGVQPEIEINILTRRDAGNSLYHRHDFSKEQVGEQLSRRNMKALFDIEKGLTDAEIFRKVREKLETQPRTYKCMFGEECIQKIVDYKVA